MSLLLGRLAALLPSFPSEAEQIAERCARIAAECRRQAAEPVDSSAAEE